MEFIGVCLNFLLFFKSVDVVDGSLCGKDAITWVEFVGANLGDVVDVCNVSWRRGDAAGEYCGREASSL